MERPTILDARYRDLDDSTKLREYKRDLLLYEQAVESKRIADLNEKAYNDNKEKEIQQLNEKVAELTNQLNQNRQNDILNLYLDNLSEEGKIEYIKQKEIEENKEKRKRSYQYRIDSAADRIYYAVQKVQDVFDRNRKIHNKIEYNYSRKDILERKLSKNEVYLGTGAICIPIFGFVASLIYHYIYSGNLNIAIKLCVIIYILYLLFFNIRKFILKSNYNSTLNNIDDYELIRDYDFENYIKVNKIDKTIQQNEQLYQYKLYCINYIKRLKEKYLNTKEDFNTIDINLLDKVSEYIVNVELPDIEDLIE